MARQVGLIKLKGKIGDISLYKTQDGHLAREKGGVSAERIASDPAFVRTRENGVEFGSSAGSGKSLRTALFVMLQTASDNRVVSRLTKVMTDIKNLDGTSARGLRNVGVAIVLPAAQALLKNFNFNMFEMNLDPVMGQYLGYFKIMRGREPGIILKNIGIDAQLNIVLVS